MDKRILLIIAILGLIFAMSMFSTYAIFPGTHTVNTNRSTPVEFCIKCHPTKVTNVSMSVHANAGCICHGFNPNISEIYNINVAHNLTKQIYCTNCHSNYSISTGNITIHVDGGRNISGINQSAHYIIPGSSNKTPLYDRAKSHFNGS